MSDSNINLIYVRILNFPICYGHKVLSMDNYPSESNRKKINFTQIFIYPNKNKKKKRNTQLHFYHQIRPSLAKFLFAPIKIKNKKNTITFLSSNQTKSGLFFFFS